MLSAGWGLTRIHLGSLYRFIARGSNDITFYGFVFIFVRVAPSIGYRFLLQVDGHDCMLIQVMGVMTEVPFLGSSVVKYSPSLMFVVSLLVVFNVWDRLARCLHLKNIVFNVNSAEYSDFENGKKILTDIKPDLKEDIENAVVEDLGDPESFHFRVAPLLSANNQY